MRRMQNNRFVSWAMSATFRICLLTVSYSGLAQSLIPGISQPTPMLGNTSLNEQRGKLSEARSAVEGMLQENTNLREKVAVLEATVAELQKNLAIAQDETAVFQETSRNLQLRLEALGLDAAKGDRGLEKRVIDATKALAETDASKTLMRETLIQLYESVLAYQKVAVTSDPQARAAVEVEMRNAGRALGFPNPQVAQAEAVAATLTDGMVVATKDDLALVVINLGSKQGVKVGMPFQVLRDDAVIGLVRVVDVREKIAGAVIQEVRSDRNQERKIKVRDRVKVDAQI